MLLLKSYIGVAGNETGSSRFPKIAIQKVSHSTLGLVACNSTKKSKCSEQIRKSWEKKPIKPIIQKPIKLFMGLFISSLVMMKPLTDW